MQSEMDTKSSEKSSDFWKGYMYYKILIDQSI